MYRLSISLLALLLCSCSTITHTDDPAQSYASTTVDQQSAGTIHITADWDYLENSTVKEPRIISVGGFEAHIVQGKCRYSYYVFEETYQAKASAVAKDWQTLNRKMESLDFSRAKLDQAAQGNGITVQISERHRKQFFSAAYLRGFLQKVDEVLRSPAAKPAAPAIPQPRKKTPNPTSIALTRGPLDGHL